MVSSASFCTWDSPRGLVASVDLNAAYFHIQIAQHHRRFLRFSLEGTAYQYPVLLFELALTPRTFSKCLDAALFPPSERAGCVFSIIWMNGCDNSCFIRAVCCLFIVQMRCGDMKLFAHFERERKRARGELMLFVKLHLTESFQIIVFNLIS